MKLSCPKCNALVLAEDINEQMLVAKCNSCNDVFSFSDSLPPVNQNLPKLKIGIPSNVIVEDDGSVRRVVHRWFKKSHLGLFVFALIWNGFLVGWFSMASNIPENPFRIMFLLFPILHVAVGIGLLYFCVSGFFNRTWITVTDEAIDVRHGPIPVGGNRHVAVADIRQIYCDENVHQQEHGHSFTFNVKALMHDGRMVVLLKRMQDKPFVLFIKQQLDEWLKIRPEHVPGSLV
jgi:hypothetical protein